MAGRTDARLNVGSFRAAEDGNIALTGNLPDNNEFDRGRVRSQPDNRDEVVQSLAEPFSSRRSVMSTNGSAVVNRSLI
jgi:hypothetical protein